MLIRAINGNAARYPEVLMCLNKSSTETNLHLFHEEDWKDISNKSGQVNGTSAIAFYLRNGCMADKMCSNTNSEKVHLWPVGAAQAKLEILHAGTVGKSFKSRSTHPVSWFYYHLLINIDLKESVLFTCFESIVSELFFGGTDMFKRLASVSFILNPIEG